MKRGFSFSTAVLVVLLLGVVVWVGRIVNPPTPPGGHDHDHAAESQAAPPQSKAQIAAAELATRKAEMAKRQEMQEKMKTRMAEEMKKQKRAAKMPHVDAMDATYWQNHEMGAVAVKPDVKSH